MLSIGYVVNALLAWWLFKEDVNAQRWLGIGVIIVGVVLVARSGAHS
jgi:multidrug transporter EmrE-like cation transporter